MTNDKPINQCNLQRAAQRLFNIARMQDKQSEVLTDLLGFNGCRVHIEMCSGLITIQEKNSSKEPVIFKVKR